MTAQQRHNFAARNIIISIMNTKYTIKNFRVFDEKGVTVDIKPITILTGCNSSGKSSIVKSMVLLNTYIEDLQEDYKAFGRIDLKKHKLNFTKDTTISLGNFNRVRHSGSKDKTITFQYQVHPLLLGEDVIVSLVFMSDDNDELNEGYLKEISIQGLSGDVIYTSSEEKPCAANYNLIVNNFFRFAYGQLLVDIQNEYRYRHHLLYGMLTEDEFLKSLSKLPTDMREGQEADHQKLKDFKATIDAFMSSYVSSYGEDSLIDMQKWMKKNGKDRYAFNDDNGEEPLIERWLNGHYEVLDVSLRWNTLFYFPLLEKLNKVDSSSFKDILLKMLEGITLEKEVLYAIDKISNDFKSSREKTFGEYFKKKETSFLILDEKRFGSSAPFINGTCLLKTDSIFGGKIYDDTYLQWTRRMQGPEFIEDKGNLLQMIGNGEYEDWENCPVDFYVLYDVMMSINHLMDNSESCFFSIEDKQSNKLYYTFKHHLFEMFVEYSSMVMKEVITSAIPQNLSYIGTSLVSVKRDYSLDSNDSFASLTKRYFAARRNYKNSKEKGILGTENFISRWIQKLGLGYSVGIEVNPSGSSFAVRIYKSAEDTVGTILAEEGYGVTQIVTLLLRIETAILESEKIRIRDYDEDGTRVTNYVHSESTIAIEEPEVHLHPKFQSLLAEMFVEAYKKYNVHFIVETHSEYLIRKLQVMVADKEISLTSGDISLNYVEKEEGGSSNRKIDILEDGRLKEPFGPGFFDEADSLAMEILKYKARRR